MNSEPETVIVHILGKDYRVACPPSEKDGLIESAAYLNQRMEEIRHTGKVLGSDRIAVMAALNITHELLELRSKSGGDGDVVGQRLEAISSRLERLIEGTA
jgi:cell division protein ZapA